MTDMEQISIRDMQEGEEFGEWLADLIERDEAETGRAIRSEDRYLVLTDAIGDWIGGLRYSLQGGVARLVQLAVRGSERHQGHAHRLLQAFEERAGESGAHLVEFWTDDIRSHGFLSAIGWRAVLAREDYVGHRRWYLMEKPLPQFASVES